MVGSKVCALASRVATRDYVDTAAALQHFSTDQLIGFALRLDSGLTRHDFADAARRLDGMDDDLFTRYGLTPRDVAVLREQFAAWPRS